MDAERTDKVEAAPDLERYSRQVLFGPIGELGQRRLLASRATLIGCGALGSNIANLLVRAGIGHLRIVDRDYLERSNLQRQVLFDEDDLAADLPKAEAARRKLARINPQVQVEAVVEDAAPWNVERLVAGADVILDGTDNFETRFLINDVAVRHRLPWIYGACVGSVGLSLTILPGETPCLRCVFEEAPPPEMNPTCETVGILATAAATVAARQVTEAMKILAGRREAVDRRLVQFDVWSGRTVYVNVGGTARADCPCCGRREFEYLSGQRSSRTAVLCGRNAVQVRPPAGTRTDLAGLADRLRPVSTEPPVYNEFLLRARIAPYEITVFADGRAIIHGTHRPEEARSIYARYIGS